MRREKIKNEKGISLIELMVALAIGLILLLALASLMWVANQSSLQRTTSELLDETARQVFSRLETDLQQAGYVDSFQDNITVLTTLNAANQKVFARYGRQVNDIADAREATALGVLTSGRISPIVGCNQNFTSDSLEDPLNSCANVAPTVRQALQISYQAIRADGSSGFSQLPKATQENLALSGSNRSCNGQTASNKQPIISNRYFIDSVSAGSVYSNLECDSNISDFAAKTITETRPQPVTLGVEQIVFRYLVTQEDNLTQRGKRANLASTESGRSVFRYLDANAVNAQPLRWASVVGIEVCIVTATEPLEGAREAGIAASQPTIPSCLRAPGAGAMSANAAWQADLARPAGDARLYRRYIRTINLPNNLYL